MSIVITTPTGHIGRVLTARLLDAGEKPILVARDPHKVEDFTKRGASVVKGSHSDAAALTEATKRADALFVLTPTDPRVTDIRGHYRRFAEAAAAAIEKNRIRHVVHLSSVGAEIESGTGPVVGLHEAEQILGRVCDNLTNLRPAYFMENTLGQIPNILATNSMFTTFPRGARFPMIATRDIAARAAELLMRRNWGGERIVELHGPGDTSYEEVAAALSEVLSRQIQHVTVSPSQFREALVDLGLSEVLAESYNELANAFIRGRVKFHAPRSSDTTTPTSYPVFAKEVFKPAFDAAARSR